MRVYDSVIIGGGMSGLMAAIKLADQGRSVALVSKGDPVCCLSTGCVDVLSGEGTLKERLKALPKEHPYKLVGEQEIVSALDYFKEVVGDYLGEPSANRDIMTPVGTAKSTCLVPGTMAKSEAMPEEYLHVISFAKIKDFFPSYITARHKNSGYSVFDAGVGTTLGIANKFDEPEFRAEFISWLKDLEIPDGRLAIPAVLGILNSQAVLDEITAATDREIFEIPTLPPSIPGLRLFKRLKQVLQDKGGDLYWGKEIASVERSGSKIEAITLAKSGRTTRLEGKTFILATGSFVSGGLYAGRDSVRETVFDLNLDVPSDREEWFGHDFFQRGHEIEKVGIKVDKEFRPDGQDNLFVCGSILANSEIMKYQCGHGLAIATGVAAAKNCEEQLS